MTEMIKIVFDEVENIVGKGENASNLIPQCFLRAPQCHFGKSRLLCQVLVKEYLGKHG